MLIRKGVIADINEIMSIIKSAIQNMEAQQIYQWDDIYPNADVIASDINNGHLYVYLDENIIFATI